MRIRRADPPCYVLPYQFGANLQESQISEEDDPMAELSGSQWCARFPGSRSVNDLAVPFRNSVVAFLSALHAADPPATVVVNATLRPPQRAYLMHYAWLIAHGQIRPGAVPPVDGVDIIWDHPDAISAAQAMVDTYRMAFVGALGKV